MKKLIAVVVLLLLAGTAHAQLAGTKLDRFGLRNVSSGTAWTAKAYTTTLKDTSQSVPVASAINPAFSVIMMLQSKDSASCAVYYQPSWDGVTFGAQTFIDSLSTDSNTGAVKGFALPAGAYAYPAVRFILNFGAYNGGTSSATFNAKVVRLY